MTTNNAANIQLVFMITIVNRGMGENLAKVFVNAGISLNIIIFGKGTASSEILNYLGIDETEKDIIISTAQYDVSREMLEKLSEEVAHPQRKSHGIAFTIPVSSVAGINSIKMMGGEISAVSGGTKMEKTNKDLVVAIANRGFAFEVMEAAKSANATGGTVLHGRGTGLKEAEKFFGVTVQPEKEVVLILCPSADKANIMKAIIEKAGPATNAKAIVFSLPVNGVAGLSAFSDELKG